MLENVVDSRCLKCKTLSVSEYLYHAGPAGHQQFENVFTASI